MHATTNNCHKHGHPEVLLNCEDAPFLAPGLKWLLDVIENEVASGKQYHPDQTVQVGWSVMQVRRRADGTLGFFELDFKSMPTVSVDNVSNTLLHLLLQKSVNESLGLENELLFAPLNHRAIICHQFKGSKDIVLTRIAPKKNDSGWFFGCSDSNHNHQVVENLQRISVYEAAVSFDDRIIPYLALPAGIQILINNSRPRFFYNHKELPIKPNSYLQQKFPES
jgi:hypothetical protein